MNDFAHLLDRLGYEPRRNAKLRLLQDFFRHAPDPERGYALAAMTGHLSFREAKPGLIRGLVEARVDPELFRMSYHYVGDLAEATALIWPAAPEPEPGAPGHNRPPPQVPSLAEVVETLGNVGKAELPARIALWLDALDETGRWALLKLITGELRVGVSARLAKTAVASLGGFEADAVEEVWHGLKAPYEPLFAWVEGKGERPESLNPAPFRPPMLSHPIEDEDFPKLDPGAFGAEWKWDGIRVQLAGGLDRAGQRVARIYSRTGEDISGAFPDLTDAITFAGALDGELLILREERVQSFNVLQQRLNRKAVTPKLLRDFPAHVRAYDLLAADGEDLRGLPFAERRTRLEAFVAGLDHARIDVSPLVPFADWEALAAARRDPAAAGGGPDADAIEGVMLKRLTSPYMPGRPKGPWWKWKREPYRVDAVMMYAQRGHGKRSSFYSDYTFGVWRDAPDGSEELVPVGKAYHGFTDEELARLDRYVRNHTVKRFGPVREVEYGLRTGLVLEIAFEGVQRSTRHKSGVAMRFPRVGRIRWDKPTAEADRIEALERILERGEREIRPGEAIDGG
ncbi:cisplatin damage response ATP-dependent DNA ligase [Methylobacterium oryzihabitans]|uniref:DNA ligase (ATP) n=1 Tax=Methylobacterium oryzihabitans TaxID=2499852 RepID=A0A3S2VQ09_9HYPH|nr:cisplatin damage response ATP-dependent DNA ligase [Methylobacterium oryzihabitans]RVU18055.1 cisplatin damage response ATP-dependent DNA ligase [Methylobacterium oryzihabitans]